MGYAIWGYNFEHMKGSQSGKEKRVFLEQLYEMRMQAGMRQADLAEKLKVPQSFVSKIESGERRVDIVELRQICRALGCSLEEFSRNFEKALGGK
jgi:transcriptional regulator with XRE-family HTH domain